jgi:hypothetical protein
MHGQVAEETRQSVGVLVRSPRTRRGGPRAPRRQQPAPPRPVSPRSVSRQPLSLLLVSPRPAPARGRPGRRRAPPPHAACEAPGAPCRATTARPALASESHARLGGSAQDIGDTVVDIAQGRVGDIPGLDARERGAWRVVDTRMGTVGGIEQRLCSDHLGTWAALRLDRDGSLHDGAVRARDVAALDQLACLSCQMAMTEATLVGLWCCSLAQCAKLTSKKSRTIGSCSFSGPTPSRRPEKPEPRFSPSRPAPSAAAAPAGRPSQGAPADLTHPCTP